MDRTDEIAAAILTAARLMVTQPAMHQTTHEAIAEQYVEMIRAVQAALGQIDSTATTSEDRACALRTPPPTTR